MKTCYSSNKHSESKSNVFFPKKKKEGGKWCLAYDATPSFFIGCEIFFSKNTNTKKTTN